MAVEVTEISVATSTTKWKVGDVIFDRRDDAVLYARSRIGILRARLTCLQKVTSDFIYNQPILKGYVNTGCEYEDCDWWLANPQDSEQLDALCDWLIAIGAELVSIARLTVGEPVLAWKDECGIVSVRNMRDIKAFADKKWDEAMKEASEVGIESSEEDEE